MRIAVLLFLALLAPADAQTPPSAVGAPPGPPAPVPATSLNVTAAERRYFELGDVLAKAAFSYVPLARQATHLPHGQSDAAQLAAIGRLAPDARKARSEALAQFTRAVALMQQMNAPDSALAPVALMTTHLGKPLAMTGDAQEVGALSRDAGTVLAALSESEKLSDVISSPALQKWLTGAGSSTTGKVWYAEGLMAGVSETAARIGQPTLLPAAAELATDLRGLRDWLSLRLPETPTPEQAALQTAINHFLQQNVLFPSRHKPLSQTQLRDLGEISRMLQAQILPEAPQDASPVPPAGAGVRGGALLPSGVRGLARPSDTIRA